MKNSILIVDDMEANRVILQKILSDEYNILEAASGREALDILFHTPRMPDAILLDIMMPGMDGYEVLAALRLGALTKHIPVLVITATDAIDNESRALDEGAVDFILKPFNSDVIRARIRNHIQLRKYRQSLESMLEQKIAEVTRLHERMLETMASIIEYRGMESSQHIRKMTDMTRILSNQLMYESAYARQLVNMNRETLFKAVALHDIGKIAVPDNILLKPGKVTAEEYEIIKTHTIIGSEIIHNMRASFKDDAGYLERAEEICRSHHEWWNGQGYPDGLAEEKIPLSARILAVIVVYDALVGERCYKEPVSHAEAVEIIMAATGSQFDPVITEAFLEIQHEFAELQNAP